MTLAPRPERASRARRRPRQSLVYPDGYSFSVNATDGKKHTYKCNDGTWEETVSLTAPPPRVSGVVAIGTSTMVAMP